jgi:hypothetical protein
MLFLKELPKLIQLNWWVPQKLVREHYFWWSDEVDNMRYGSTYEVLASTNYNKSELVIYSVLSDESSLCFSF